MICAFDHDSTEARLGARVPLGHRAARREATPIEETHDPAQTVGPYFAIGLPWPDGPDVVPEGTEGAIWLRGTVFDGARDPIPDALIETWQADPGRELRDARLPRLRPLPDRRRRRVGDLHGQAGRDRRARRRTSTSACSPAGCCTASSPGSTSPTRRGNAADPVLAGLDEAARATLDRSPREGDGYRFDVRLQGDDETVFFAV